MIIALIIINYFYPSSDLVFTNRPILEKKKLRKVTSHQMKSDKGEQKGHIISDYVMLQ